MLTKLIRYKSFENWLIYNYPSKLNYNITYFTKLKKLKHIDTDEYGNTSMSESFGSCFDNGKKDEKMCDTDIHVAANNKTSLIMFIIAHEYKHHLQIESDQDKNNVYSLEKEANDFAIKTYLDFKRYVKNKNDRIKR